MMKSLSRISKRSKVPRRSYFRATDVFPYSDIVWVRLFRFRSFLCVINAEPNKILCTTYLIPLGARIYRLHKKINK